MKNINTDFVSILVAIVATLLASSGFWTYLANRREKNSATTKMLMGLAHDKIVTNGMRAINNGYIHTDEYDDLRKYLYEPYIELGGNGIVERIMVEVSKLPLTQPKNFEPKKEPYGQFYIK